MNQIQMDYVKPAMLVVGLSNADVVCTSVGDPGDTNV